MTKKNRRGTTLPGATYGRGGVLTATPPKRKKKPDDYVVSMDPPQTKKQQATLLKTHAVVTSQSVRKSQTYRWDWDEETRSPLERLEESTISVDFDDFPCDCRSDEVFTLSVALKSERMFALPDVTVMHKRGDSWLVCPQSELSEGLTAAAYEYRVNAVPAEKLAELAARTLSAQTETEKTEAAEYQSYVDASLNRVRRLECRKAVLECDEPALRATASRMVGTWTGTAEQLMAVAGLVLA